MGTVGWGALVGGGYPIGPPTATGLGDLGLLDATFHAFTTALQGVVMAGVIVAPPSSPDAPAGRVRKILLRHPRFACGMAGDGYLTPIWEAILRGKISMEGLATLNHTLMKGIPSCCQVFGGRTHFRDPPTPGVGKKRVYVEPLPRPSLLWGGG